MTRTRITTVRRLSDQEFDALTAARTNLLSAPKAASRAYYAVALYKTTPVAAEGLGTWAVDKHWRMYIDPAYLPGGSAGWTAADCADVIEHELGHLLRGHCARMDAHCGVNQDRERSNTATDAEINDDTAPGSFVRRIGVMPERLGLPEFNTAEWYYDHLLSMDGGEGSGDQAGPGTNPGPGGSTQGPCGSGAGNPIDGELPGDTDGDVGASPLSEGDAELARRSVAIAIREHLAAHGRGSVPGGLVQWADVVLTPPKLPWQHMLRAAGRHSTSRARGGFDYTYTHLSRRSSGLNAPGRARIVLPGTYAPQICLDAIQDTSGSMSIEMVFEGLSEVEGIANSAGIRGENLRLIQVDAAVASIQPVYDLRHIRLSGRGGTDMREGIRASLAMHPQAQVQVILTDGDTPLPATAPPRGVEQIWVMFGKHAEKYAQHMTEKMPWAQVVVAR